MTYTTNDDGSLTFPCRGKPPPLIPGYSRDPKNPFRMIPDWVDCDHRETKTDCLPCGRTVCNEYCNIFKKNVNYYVCRDCSFEPKNA